VFSYIMWLYIIQIIVNSANGRLKAVEENTVMTIIINPTYELTNLEPIFSINQRSYYK